MRAAALTTRYPRPYDWDGDAVRAKLALDTVTRCAELGWATVIVDGGTPDSFQEELKNAGAVIVQEPDGYSMGDSRRLVLKEAAGVIGPDGTIILIEAEKNSVPSMLGNAIDKVETGGVDLVIPNRGVAGLRTCPDSQIAFESAGNAYFDALFGNYVELLHDDEMPHDMWFGPRIIGPRARDAFQRNKSLLWSCQFTPVAELAVTPGFRVASVLLDGNYTYPIRQYQQEQGDRAMTRKRRKQLVTITGDLDTFEEEATKLGLIAA